MNSEVVKKVPMKDYYTQRVEIQKLYIHDTHYGDLAGALLGVREANRYIESMRLNIQSFQIRIELIEGKDEEECKEILYNIDSIYNKIKSIIDKFIVDNIDQVTDSDTANEIKSNISKGYCYYDISHIGNMIDISL